MFSQTIPTTGSLHGFITIQRKTKTPESSLSRSEGTKTRSPLMRLVTPCKKIQLTAYCIARFSMADLWREPLEA
jgi:hypothetical protein